MTKPEPHDRQSAASTLALCPQCDWVMRLAPPGRQQRAYCPRCGHSVAEGPVAHRFSDTMAWAIAALIMLALVFAFDFLSFETRGIGHTMTFADAARALGDAGYPALALLFILTTAVLPGLFLVGAVYINSAALGGRALPLVIPVARLVRHAQMWMMSDVLLVGILVSLIKIVSLAQIGLGPSFIMLCLFSLLLLKTMNMHDWPRLWRTVAGAETKPAGLRGGRTGRQQHVIPCSCCEAVIDAHGPSHCRRCGHRHWLRRVPRLQLTMALLVTALMLYIPANIYPIMTTHSLVGSEGQTIAGGVLHLIALGSWPIALVIFVASIVVPLTKIAALSWLCLCGRYGVHRDSAVQNRLFRFTELIGRWSMIDVFVVAILAALVQAGALMSITPGPAAVSFAAVVITTMIAAKTFDSRVLWQRKTQEHP